MEQLVSMQARPLNIEAHSMFKSKALICDERN